MENITQYQDSCRVCAIKRSNDIQMATLFQTTVNTINLAEMFTVCTAIILKPNDLFPQLICTTCLSNLVAAYEFMQQCINTDNQIRNELVTAGFLEVVSDETSPTAIADTTESPKLQSISIIKEEENVEIEETYKVADVEIEEIVQKSDETQEYTNVSEIIQVHSPLPPLPTAQKNDVESNSEIKDNLPLKQKSSSNDNIAPSSGKRKRNICGTAASQHECKICGKIFDKPYRLIRHSNVHNTNGKPYECELCKIRFVTESRLIRHKIKHTDLLLTQKQTDIVDKKSQIFPCTQCNREFTKQESLSSHSKVHNSITTASDGADEEIVKEYLCEFCPKKFPKLNLLTRHLKIHDEIKGNKCSICDRTFALGGQLIDHMNRHKGIKPHICPFCNKGFQQSCTLKDHIRTHSGETPFLCSECGKSFNNSSNLRQHLLRHTGVKPFACTECPSRFSCKGGLKSHMVVHSGLKPFVCDICGHSFTKTYSLAKHKRIHTGERPYACEMCDMRFNSSDHVKRHMRTHTGEKPYKCEFCERAFSQSNDLVKHRRSHVGDNTYQCKQCPAAFRLHSELRGHSKIHYLEEKGSNQGNSTIAIDSNSSETTTAIIVVSDTLEHEEPIDQSTASSCKMSNKSELLYIKDETQQPSTNVANFQQFTQTILPTTAIIVPVSSDIETGPILIQHIQLT